MINLEDYNENGFYFPLEALNQEKVNFYLSNVYKAIQLNKDNPKLDCLNKSYLLFSWANSLIRERKIINEVSRILGPNLFCYSLNIFVKQAGSNNFVSPHQDSSYWFLDPPELVTAWIALTDVKIDQGPISYWAKTHKIGELPFENIKDKNNLLKSGQTTNIDFRKYKKENVLLNSGQMSIHHLQTVHGSSTNTSKNDRIGVAIRYMPTHVKNLKQMKSAMLVSGYDDYNFWKHENEAVNDLGKKELKHHMNSMSRGNFIKKIFNFF